MKIRSVKIKNFKAIDETEVPISDFTVVVGTNGSGKSSVLQAIHWMLQSARNPQVKPQQIGGGSTLSEIDATYMPSPDYRNASHSGEYGNFAEAPKLELVATSSVSDDEPIQIPMWIKSARNEGISVHVPSNNPFTTAVRASSREVTAYIPGLAGIPLIEEKRSKLIVYRRAAAGDANTVLRNVLELASQKNGQFLDTALAEVEHFVSDVLGDLKIRVSFEEDKHYKINAEFQTEKMKISDPKRFKPLELAGIGFLQVIQIFSYLVYFKPRILLVDEPDSHLHPDVQERLVSTLIRAAKDYDCQVLLTTHSPSVVRSLPSDASLVWMKDGKVESDNTDSIRKSMGWGLLDKSILLITEDSKVNLLNELINQWPDLRRRVAVWAARGSSTLPPPDVLSELSKLFGAHMQVLLHRDSDFMLVEDQALYREPYEKMGLNVWLPDGCDIEAAWTYGDAVAAHFGIELDAATAIVTEACNRLDASEARKRFNTKRNQLPNFIEAYRKGTRVQRGHDDAFAAHQKLGRQACYLGKELVSKIREVASGQGLAGVQAFGKVVPQGVKLAPSLERALRSL